MLEPGWFLYISGTVQNRFHSDELEFKISNIEHLSEIREKMTKGIELEMYLKDVNETTISEIERLATSNPGKCSMKLSVVGAHEDRVIKLDTISRKFSIDVNDQLIKELRNLEEIRYEVVVG